MKNTMDIIVDIFNNKPQQVFCNFGSSKLLTFFERFDSSQIWDCTIKNVKDDTRIYGYGSLDKDALSKGFFKVGDVTIEIEKIHKIKDLGFDQFVGFTPNQNIEFWFQPEWESQSYE